MYQGYIYPQKVSVCDNSSNVLPWDGTGLHQLIYTMNCKHSRTYKYCRFDFEFVMAYNAEDFVSFFLHEIKYDINIQVHRIPFPTTCVSLHMTSASLS